MATTYTMKYPLETLCEQCKDTGKNVLTIDGYCTCTAGKIKKDADTLLDRMAEGK